MRYPRDHGYFMPPDWARHDRYWMAWPSGAEVWGRQLDAAREAVADVAKMMAEQAPVTVLANPAEVADVSLSCGPGVAAMVVPHGDCCMRSIGPTFLLDYRGGMAGIRWSDREEEVAAALLGHLDIPTFEGPPGMSGGYIDVDGEGTCLASEALSAEFGSSRERLDEVLSAYLGIERVIWLKPGLEGDLRGGQILDLARFLRPGLVAAQYDEDRADPNGEVLRENFNRLKAARDARNRALTVVPLPQPKRKERPDGSRICMSYTNCLVNSNFIALPAFEESRDAVAYDRVVSALLDHVVVLVPVADLAYGAGGLGNLVLSQPCVRSLT